MHWKRLPRKVMESLPLEVADCLSDLVPSCKWQKNIDRKKDKNVIKVSESRYCIPAWKGSISSEARLRQL